MRVTFISQLAYQVAFSFEPDGLIYISCHRYIGFGKMRLNYARLGDFLQKEFKLEEARQTIVYLHESERKNICLGRQPAITVFDVEILKREILLEKCGDKMRKELKKIKYDPLHLAIHYCSVKNV